MRGRIGRSLGAAVGALFCAGLLLGAGFAVARDRARIPAPTAGQRSLRSGRHQQFWPNGRLKADLAYAHDAYDGEYRTYYQSGAPYELRHYVNGHEEGLQRSWTEEGVLYLNYEVHAGRRYGLVNASPCNAIEDAAAKGGRAVANRDLSSRGPAGQHNRDEPEGETPRGPESGGLPYYDSPDFMPKWHPVDHRVAPFVLTTQTGAVVSDASLRGQPYVASFIYSQCAAVCPILVQQLSRVQKAIVGRGARIISFSVTPDSDTPEVLARFGHERGVDAQVWSLVTGTRKVIYGLARRSYYADDTRVGRSEDDEAAFLHTEKLLLVDGDGHLRGVYNGTQPHAVDQLIADLVRLASRHG